MFPDYDENFYYFSYVSNSESSRSLVNHLININKLLNVKIKKFES